MRYEWDENKRLSNLVKHKLDFRDAPLVFKNLHMVLPTKYVGEERFLAISFIKNLFVTIVYTYRGENIRVISFRRARNGEKRKYQKLYGKGAS
jgi:uncharacterized DUF497 family protein